MNQNITKRLYTEIPIYSNLEENIGTIEAEDSKVSYVVLSNVIST